MQGASATAPQPINCGNPWGWRLIKGKAERGAKETSLQHGFHITEIEVWKQILYLIISVENGQHKDARNDIASRLKRRKKLMKRLHASRQKCYMTQRNKILTSLGTLCSSKEFMTHRNRMYRTKLRHGYISYRSGHCYSPRLLPRDQVKNSRRPKGVKNQPYMSALNTECKITYRFKIKWRKIRRLEWVVCV